MNEIYSKLRELRKEKNITLMELSKSTGLSLSFLSQAERGLCDITLMSLGKIANTLDIDLKELFDNNYETKYYCSEKDHKKINTKHSFLKYTRLSGDFADKKLDTILVTCMPKSPKTEYELHDGEEFVYVLEGEATIEVDEVVYKVKKGESIHYPSSLKHTLKNDGNTEMKAIITVTQILF